MKILVTLLALLILSNAFSMHRIKILKKDGTTDVIVIASDTQISFSDGNPAHRLKVQKKDSSHDIYNLSDIVVISFNTTGIAESPEKIKEIPISLLKNYPNPFNPSTSISFELSKAGLVTVAVYNQKGELLQELGRQNLEAGQHHMKWNAGNSASGVFFTKVTMDNVSKVSKMNFVK